MGRDEELDGLVAVVTDRPGVAVVAGEAGIGKSRLVRELLGHREVAGLRALVGRCHGIREAFPLGPVVEAVRGVGEGLTAARLSSVTGVLRPLLPEIAQLLPAAPAALEDRAAERHRVFRGLVQLLGAVGPAVLVLEDLHWADEQTVDFVGYLLADLPANLAVVLTFRNEEVDAHVRAVTATLSPETRYAEVELAPLDAEQTGVLAGAILGLDRVSEEFAGYLCERTAGLPFAIEELLALLRARGSVVRHGGRWARWTLDELDVPTGIRNQVLERVDRLGGDARSVAETAAVLQVPVAVSVLLATCRAGKARALRGVEEGLDSGVLAERGEHVGLRHPLAAQALYEAVPGPRRQDLHARAAAALRALDPVPLGQVAHHLRRAGLLHEWAVAAERAADQAVELGHDDEAARLLEDLLRHSTLSSERRGQVAVKLGRAAVLALRASGDVVGLLSEELEKDLASAVRGELRLRLGQLVEKAGADYRLQLRLLAESVEDLADRPDLMANAMLALGLPMVPGGSLAEHKHWLHRVLELVPAVDDQAFQVFLSGKVAMILASVGDRDWRRLTDRIVDQTAGAPRQYREVNAYHSVGLEACYAGHLDAAQRLLAVGLQGAIACESEPLQLRFRSARALLGYCTGAWDGLADEAEVLIDRLADYAPSRADVEVVAGCLALAQGNLNRALDLLQDVVQRLEQRGALDLLPIPASALIRLALGRGEVSPALTAAGRLIATVESIPFEVSALRALPAIAEAVVAGGNLREAESLVTRWAGEVRELDAPLAVAALPHARGFLVAAGHRWPTAAHHFAAAAKQYERLMCPYEAAQARERAASSLLAAGGEPPLTGHAQAEHAQAEQALRSALASYQRLGATWDAARATRTAREHGVSLPSRHRGGRRGYGGELSPRQREVAALAATGQTNREIGVELFLSPSTVNHHLIAAMRKLGVSSRRVLAQRLGDAGRGGGSQR